jgi:TonB family protein
MTSWGAALVTLALLTQPRAVRAADAAAYSVVPDGGAHDDGALDARSNTGVIQEGTGPAVVGPQPLAPIEPAYPEAAQEKGIEGEVALVLSIDARGEVTDVVVEKGLPEGLTEAAVAAARRARFRAAADAEGRPVPVRVRWVVRFTRPLVRKRIDGGATTTGAPADAGVVPAAAAASDRVRAGDPGRFTIRVREKGTGRLLPEATVYIEDNEEIVRLDDQARAERVVAPGAYAVIVNAPGHAQLESLERVRSGEALERTYFIERQRLNPYETIIVATPDRAQAGVVTLEAQEIRSTPGTFGDPFRTVMLLPGVASPISGLGYPVVRGESPGATGTFIDDVRVPLLYHLGFGPAVVHPMYVERLDFHPGGFPAEHGRFTAGLIHVHTTGAAEARQSMLEADLFKFSAYHNQPFTLRGREGAVSAAARYGTFAFLARALDPNAVLSYWDYQTRGDLRLGPGQLRLLVFGAQDALGEKAPPEESEGARDQILTLGFHRIDARYRAPVARGVLVGGLELGVDWTKLPEDEVRPSQTPGPPMSMPASRHLQLQVARPRLSMSWPLGRWGEVKVGADTLMQRWTRRIDPMDLGTFPVSAVSPGAYLQADLRFGKRWLVTPGVRVDHYRNFYQSGGLVWQTGVDPRLAARFEVRPDFVLKSSFGLFQAPPRFLVPWPGLEGFALERGLSRSYQASIGSEHLLPWNLSLSAQVYFAYLPRVHEFNFSEEAGDDLAAMMRVGRAYGLELMLRRRLGQRLSGWLTYTYGRSERKFLPDRWAPADFDQPHLVNGVISYALGRAWTVGAAFHLNSGRPVTPETGTRSVSDVTARAERRNLDRLPVFWRIDARIEKREAFDTWFLDFYVDWLNVSLRNEVVSYRYHEVQPGVVERRSETTLLTIPTIGLRAVF